MFQSSIGKNCQVERPGIRNAFFFYCKELKSRKIQLSNTSLPWKTAMVFRVCLTLDLLVEYVVDEESL